MDAEHVTEIRHRLKHLDEFAHIREASVLVPTRKDLIYLATLLREDVPALLNEQARLQKALEESTAREIRVSERHRPVSREIDFTDSLVDREPKEVQVCAECDRIREEIDETAAPVLWPCSTVSDLDGDTTTETRKDAA